MQKAHVIYNDRIITFTRCKEIDAVIDSDPTPELIKELAEKRIRNLDCFRELKSFNDTGKFKYVHPIIRMYSLRAELEAMLRKDPVRFTQEFAKTNYNVSRYRSYLKNKKYTKEQQEKHREQLDKHLEREKLMKEVLESGVK